MTDAVAEKKEKEIVFPPPPTATYTFRERWVYALTQLSTHVLIGGFCGFSVHGRENVPRTGPVFLASNHASDIDPLLVGTATPRQVRFMAKTELWSLHPAMTAWLNNVGSIPINREGVDRRALSRTIDLLKQGGAVSIFIEGTRSATGELQAPKLGPGMIAASAPDVQIVPVRIRDSHLVLQRGRKFPSPHPVSVTFGCPFRTSDVADLPSEKKDLYQALAAEMMRRIALL